jgi:uncharacterized membrane protein
VRLPWTPVPFLLAATAAHAAEAGPGGPGAARQVLNEILEWVSMGIEVAGVAIILVGAISATAIFIHGGLVTVGWADSFRRYRANLGRGILLGLELLVAADIIGTVAVTPSFQNLAVLALIVLIRTFLSFSLEVEIEGHWPWRRAEAEARADGGPSEKL